MSAKYLLRFDDLCSTMCWSVWNEIESILDQFEVKPIVAVIPDNRDPELDIEPPNPEFWERVRRWQTKGWAVALHGYQHLYCGSDSGLLRLNPRTEFAGDSEAVQRQKLVAALAICSANGVKPTVGSPRLTLSTEIQFEHLKALGSPASAMAFRSTLT